MAAVAADNAEAGAVVAALSARVRERLRYEDVEVEVGRKQRQVRIEVRFIQDALCAQSDYTAPLDGAQRAGGGQPVAGPGERGFSSPAVKYCFTENTVQM